MNKIVKSIIIFNFMFSCLFCVSEAGAVWLLINPGASAQGTGEAQVAKANDAYATYYNPAGLGFMEGQNVVLQHVNWLPNLVSDIFYDFIGYSSAKNGTGFGGHLIYINLGEQQHTGESPDDVFGTFKSFDICLTGSYGTRITNTSAVGFNFKVYHQKLAPFTTGNEAGTPYSTDVAFDISYLKKFGKFSQHSFGLAIQNIGPPVSFVDIEQADPAPTNMKFGIYSRLFKDDYNTLHMMLDANKLLVATYTEMDWDGDGIIGNGFSEEINDNCAMYASDFSDFNDCDNPNGGVDENNNPYYKAGWVAPNSSQKEEYTHSDEWYKAVYTSWLNDWYYGGDLNQDRPTTFLGKGNVEIGYNEYDKRIGGYRPAQFAFEEVNVPRIPFEFPGEGIPGGVEIYVPNYLNFCIEDPADCYTEDGVLIDEENYNPNNQDPLGTQIAWIDLPHDGLHSATKDIDVYEEVGCDIGGGIYDEDDCLDNGGFWDNNEVLQFTYTDYGDINYAPGVYGNLLEINPDYVWSSDNNACDQDPDSDAPTCYFDIAYDGEYDFSQDEYGSYNVWGYKEKGSGDTRKFSDEFKEMIYNFGLEWWYTDNFVMRLGYIHDDEGQVKQPTFGAGVHFSGYGFDFGYTAGAETDSRSNTMFFSLALNL